MKRLKLKKEDLFSFIWAFPGLILIGAGITAMIAFYSPTSAPPLLIAPVNVQGWIILIFSCIGTGYLEESFFRFYLLQKLEDWVLFRPVRIIFAVILFAICHSYEGYWGILNAALAGLLLSILFEKYRSLHGIAWAHACYNTVVYVVAVLG